MVSCGDWPRGCVQHSLSASRPQAGTAMADERGQKRLSKTPIGSLVPLIADFINGIDLGCVKTLEAVAS